MQACSRAQSIWLRKGARAVDYRNAYVRPGRFERDRRFRIPRDDGHARFLETVGLLIVVAVLAAAIGLMVGVPLAMALNDICASLKC